MLPVDDVRNTQAGVDPFLAWLKENGGVNFADKFDITGEANGIRLNRGGVFKKGGKGVDELAQIAESEGWLPPGSTADIDGGVPALRDMLQRSMQGERIQPLSASYDAMVARMGSVAREGEAAHLEGKLRALGVDPEPAMGNPDVLRAYLDKHEQTLVDRALNDAAEPAHVGGLPEPRQREATNTLPHPGSVTLAESAPKAEASRPAAGEAKADPGLTQRADKIAEESPDMLVQLPGSDKPVTVAQAMKEAREAYEAEAGVKEWVKAALTCALSFG
jgi:hypothetical protein